MGGRGDYAFALPSYGGQADDPPYQLLPTKVRPENIPRLMTVRIHAFALRSHAVRYRHYQRPPRPVPRA